MGRKGVVIELTRTFHENEITYNFHEISGISPMGDLYSVNTVKTTDGR